MKNTTKMKVGQKVQVTDSLCAKLDGLYATIVRISYSRNEVVYTCKFDINIDSQGLWNCEIDNFIGRNYLESNLTPVYRLNKLKRLLK